MECSGYKGVSQECRGKWIASAEFNGRNVLLGTHPSEDAAALAHDRAAIRIAGDPDAPHNFPAETFGSLEFMFSSQFSKRKVFKMIREGSYDEHLRAYLTNFYRTARPQIAGFSEAEFVKKQKSRAVRGHSTVLSLPDAWVSNSD